MFEIQPYMIIEAVSETVETMAFASALPPEEGYLPPLPGVRVTIHFQGPIDGSMEIIAPTSLGATLAANMMGCAPEAPEAQEQAIDALQELLNVTCGQLIRHLPPEIAQRTQLSGPRTEEFHDLQQWQEFVSDPTCVVFDVDFQVLAVRAHGRLNLASLKTL